MWTFFLYVMMFYLMIVLGAISSVVVGYSLRVIIYEVIPPIVELYSRIRYPDMYKD